MTETLDERRKDVERRKNVERRKDDELNTLAMPNLRSMPMHKLVNWYRSCRSYLTHEATTTILAI